MLDNYEFELILKDWNYWEQAPSPSIPRKVLKQDSVFLSPDLVWVVQGVRRCGKSTLLAQIMTSQGLNPQACTFVNFEDPRLADHLDFTLLDAIVAFSKKRSPNLEHYYFFFDEIQNIDRWEKWFHLKTARPSHESFVITGSNASLLSGELASALTGRHRTLELFPFDFEEFTAACPGMVFNDYLEKGGFPRTLRDENPQSLLREYFTDIIERDVRRRLPVRQPIVLFQMVKAVFESAGSELSQRSLAGLLGVTTDTAGTYLEACETAYLILRCPYFTFSERQRTARNRKYYPIDLGLRNAVVTKTGFDRGKKLETAVFLHLRKYYPEIYYWRGKGEVDLVVLAQQGIIPFQISWEGLKERHQKALEEFYKTFPQALPVVAITRENVGDFFAKGPKESDPLP